MDIEQGVQINELIKPLRRRASLIATITLGVLLASVVVAAILPNRYEAWSTLLVEPQTISKRLVEAGLEGSDLNSRLHLMTMQILSRGRLSRIIDDLGLYGEESEQMTREEVIALMRADIRVEPVLPELEQGLGRNQDFEINTFRLHFQGDDPDTAAAVANRLANDFIEEHIKERVQISGDTSEFIDSQREALTGQIAAVERRIAAVKAANAGKLPEDLASNQRILERATGNLRGALRELAVAESDESFYRQQALLGGEIPNFNNQASPSYRLSLLELQLNELDSRGYTEKHPDVVKTRGEIEALRSQVAAGNAADAESENLSAAQQNARAEAQRAALRANAARQEAARLQQEIAETEQRIADTPGVAEQLAALQREYDHLYESYQDFSGKGLEAGVAAGMERRQKGEQFRVLETAFPPPGPTSPNRPLIVALGLMLGLALGGATAVLLEASDSSFGEGRTLQSAVRVPVLASIPAILLESDRALARRRRVLQAAAATMLSFVVLAGAVAGNWYVNGVPGPVQTLLEGGGGEAAAAGDRVQG